MNNHLNLSDYELSLVSDGLQIMMIENAKNSNEVTEQKAQKQYEKFGLELFTLLSKIKIFDKNIGLSVHELQLMKNGLMFLADYIYQKSLKKISKDKIKHYEECNLQFIKIRGKINRMEAYVGC